MADGNFASKVSATRDANLVTNPIFVELTDGTNAIPVGGGVEAAALRVTIASDSTGVLTVDGTVAATQSGVWDIGTVTTLTGITNDVNIADGGNTITVDGTIAATQSGVWDIGTVTTLTGITNDVSIDDGGNSITVDGTVTTTFTPAGVDDAAFTVATDEVVYTGFLADETAPDSVDEGDAGIARMTVDRKQLIVITDATTDGNRLAINSDGSVNVNQVSAAITGEVHDYDTATPAGDASDNHDYTVQNTTMLLRSVIISSSGDCKFEIQSGPVASLATIAVGFLTGKEGDTKQVSFDPAVEVPVTSTGTIRVIRTNRESTATDVYSTIIGQDI